MYYVSEINGLRETLATAMILPLDFSELFNISELKDFKSGTQGTVEAQ